MKNNLKKVFPVFVVAVLIMLAATLVIYKPWKNESKKASYDESEYSTEVMKEMVKVDDSVTDVYVLEGSSDVMFYKVFNIDLKGDYSSINYYSKAYNTETFCFDKTGDFVLELQCTVLKDEMSAVLDTIHGKESGHYEEGGYITMTVEVPLHVVSKDEAKKLTEDGKKVLASDGHFYGENKE